MLLFSSADFFQYQLFKKFFQEHYQSAKRFGSRSGLTQHSVFPDLGQNCLQSQGSFCEKTVDVLLKRTIFGWAPYTSYLNLMSIML